MTLPASLPEQATAGRALAKAFANRSFLIGFVVTALIAAMALVSFLWTPYDVTRLIVADRNQAPSLAHWFGTDHFGRDILSMIMVGARNSIAVALVAVGIGTLLGAFAGRELGASLDRADQAYADRAAAQAYSAPIGQRITWNNPQSGNQGVIVPVKDGYDGSGAYCREFQQTIVVGGRTEQAFGTACRQPDGAWKIVG